MRGPLRVLLTLHHGLEPHAGAPGATLALGGALDGAGCQVEYFGFEEAFGRVDREGVGKQVRFPWHVASFLRRRALDFDVIDASTGDAWLWASLRRPGRSPQQALITRSHGLEHVVDESARAAARDGETRLGWKYPFYHGGLRLWEVRRSLLLADHCVLLNAIDRDWARDRLGVASDRLSVMPNAIAAHFTRAADVSEPTGGAVRLAFVGGWIERKGRRVLVDAVSLLLERGLDFSLSILGTGEVEGVLSAFPAAARDRIAVTPRYENEELPRLLAGHEVLVFPSFSEGSSVALFEAMACGLAPVATRVGAAPDEIEPGATGTLVEPGDSRAVADAVAQLTGDRSALLRMRRAAQARARGRSWERVARSTLELYERVLTRP